MAPMTRRGQNTPTSNTNPKNMTPESVQAMIDQALQRNSTNGDASHSSHGDDQRNVQTVRPCFYADFMKCQPLNFKVTEAMGRLNLGRSKMESVFNINGRKQINDLGSTQEEDNGQFVSNETEKVDKYISGFPNNIYGNVKSARPKTLDETIELANNLMDQKLRTYAERQFDNKWKADDSIKKQPWSTQQTPLQEAEFRQVYNIGGRGKKPSSGNTNVANTQKGNGANPKGNGSNTVQNGSFDIIIGMDWLRKYHAVIAQEYMAKSCQIFLAQISAKKEEDKLEGKKLKDVPIARDFLEITRRKDTRAERGKTESSSRGAYKERALSIHERVRALVMTIGLDLPKRILEAQIEALKPENLVNEDVGGVGYLAMET
ncbi:hypothetical protein Tco_0377467 [Tanacetum coccineum]